MEYQIRTVKDIFTVVQPESVDIFLQDLKNLFEVYHRLKKDIPDLQVLEQIDWIDDGKNDLTLNIKYDMNEV